MFFHSYLARDLPRAYAKSFYIKKVNKQHVAKYNARMGTSFKAAATT